MICADTDTRHTVKKHSTDTVIRFIVKTTAQSVIWADTDIRLIVKTTAQNVTYVIG